MPLRVQMQARGRARVSPPIGASAHTDGSTRTEASALVDAGVCVDASALADPGARVDVSALTDAGVLTQTSLAEGMDVDSSIAINGSYGNAPEPRRPSDMDVDHGGAVGRSAATSPGAAVDGDYSLRLPSLFCTDLVPSGGTMATKDKRLVS
jgi:hypothetical protein